MLPDHDSGMISPHGAGSLDRRDDAFRAGLLDGLDLAVMAYDQKGRIIYGNAAFLYLLGLDGHEATEITIQDLFEPQDLSRLLPMSHDGTKKNVGRTEMFNMRRGKSRVSIEMRLNPWCPEGAVYMLAVIRKVPVGCGAAMKDAPCHRLRFCRLAELIDTWVWETDASGTYTYSNNVSAKILGYEPSELVGRKRCFDLLPEEVDPELLRQIEDIRERRLPFRNFVRPVRAYDGRLVILESNGGPYYSDDGEFLGYRGCDRDITERRALEEEREILISELHRALEDIKTLRGLVPVCASCKKIRNDRGYWQQVDEYLRQNTEADVSHSLCQECAEELYLQVFSPKGNGDDAKGSVSS